MPLNFTLVMVLILNPIVCSGLLTWLQPSFCPSPACDIQGGYVCVEFQGLGLRLDKQFFRKKGQDSENFILEAAAGSERSAILVNNADAALTANWRASARWPGLRNVVALGCAGMTAAHSMPTTACGMRAHTRTDMHRSWMSKNTSDSMP